LIKLTKWASRWVTEKCEPFDSKIDKKGVKAIAPISRGEIVAVLGGIIVPSEEYNDYQKKIGDVGIQINDRFFICPSDEKELEETGAFNHSCEPNLGLIDSLTFVAIKDIEPGDELTFDYAMTETQASSFDCNCGSFSCRKRVESTDWKRVELQKRYGEFFSPYIRRKKEFESKE
jgi:SET domain-containing protein